MFFSMRDAGILSLFDVGNYSWIDPINGTLYWSSSFCSLSLSWTPSASSDSKLSWSADSCHSNRWYSHSSASDPMGIELRCSLKTAIRNLYTSESALSHSSYSIVTPLFCVNIVHSFCILRFDECLHFRLSKELKEPRIFCKIAVVSNNSTIRPSRVIGWIWRAMAP